MSDVFNNELIPMVERLGTYVALSEPDRTAVLGLPHSVRHFERDSYIVRDRDVTSHCAVLLSGFAFRHKITRQGLRQIVSILFPGEIINLQQVYLNIADHSVQALTHCKVATIPQFSLRTLALNRTTIADALIASTLIDASIYREWIVNIGRRDARTRIAHLLCEFATRLDVQGIAPGQSYDLPMTQEQLGDAVGLTTVHVNRTLKSLVKAGLVTLDRRGIAFPEWELFKAEADFNGRYLHLREHVTTLESS